MIASLSGRVVVTFVSMSVNGPGPWVRFRVWAIFFFVPRIYYLFLAKMLPVALVVSREN